MDDDQRCERELAWFDRQNCVGIGRGCFPAALRAKARAGISAPPRGQRKQRVRLLPPLTPGPGVGVEVGCSARPR